MKIQTESLSDCQVALSVTPDDAMVEEALRKAARQISRNYTVPGFRKGKAPYAAVLRAYGKEVLYEQMVEDLSEQVYRQALEESGLEPIAPGYLEDVTFEPLVFRLILPMAPEIDLGDYRSLRVERPEVEVDEEQIQAELERMQHGQSEWIPVDEGGAELGDLITLSLRGSSGDEIIVDEDAFELVLEEDGEDFPPEFDQQFLGKRAGERVDFDLTYPDDWRTERAGAAAHFEAEIHSVKRYDAPPLDDDFAPMMGDYDTLDELRDSIRQSLIEREEAEAREQYANAVMTQMIDQAVQISYPPVLLEDAAQRLFEERSRDLERMGLPIKEFLRMTGQSEQQFREQLLPVAEMQLKSDLVLGQLIELEQLAATDEEVEERLSELLEETSDKNLERMLRSESGRAAVANEIAHRKAIERMLAVAEGKAPPLEEAKAEATAETETPAEAKAQAQTEPEASEENESLADSEVEAKA